MDLDALIATWTVTFKADDLLEQLNAGGVPAGRVFQAQNMVTDPHFTARQAIVRLAHAEFGEIPMQNVFPKLSRTPGEVRSVGPALGEHTNEVLDDVLGLRPNEIDQLRVDGVI